MDEYLEQLMEDARAVHEAEVAYAAGDAHLIRGEM